MDQEAADELAGGERHDLLAVAAFGAIVLPFEGDAVVVEAIRRLLEMATRWV